MGSDAAVLHKQDHPPPKQFTGELGQWFPALPSSTSRFAFPHQPSLEHNRYKLRKIKIRIGFVQNLKRILQTHQLILHRCPFLSICADVPISGKILIDTRCDCGLRNQRYRAGYFNHNPELKACGEEHGFSATGWLCHQHTIHPVNTSQPEELHEIRHVRGVCIPRLDLRILEDLFIVPASHGDPGSPEIWMKNETALSDKGGGGKGGT